MCEIEIEKNETAKDVPGLRKRTDTVGEHEQDKHSKTLKTGRTQWLGTSHAIP